MRHPNRWPSPPSIHRKVSQTSSQVPLHCDGHTQPLPGDLPYTTKLDVYKTTTLAIRIPQLLQAPWEPISPNSKVLKYRTFSRRLEMPSTPVIPPTIGWKPPKSTTTSVTTYGTMPKKSVSTRHDWRENSTTEQSERKRIPGRNSVTNNPKNLNGNLNVQLPVSRR